MGSRRTCAWTRFRISVIARCAAMLTTCDERERRHRLDERLRRRRDRGERHEQFGACFPTMSSIRNFDVQGRTNPASRLTTIEGEADRERAAVFGDQFAGFFPGPGFVILGHSAIYAGCARLPTGPRPQSSMHGGQPPASTADCRSASADRRSASAACRSPFTECRTSAIECRTSPTTAEARPRSVGSRPPSAGPGPPRHRLRRRSVGRRLPGLGVRPPSIGARPGGVVDNPPGNVERPWLMATRPSKRSALGALESVEEGRRPFDVIAVGLVNARPHEVRRLHC